MGDAVEMCGPETAIISYSDHDIDVYLFCYLVFKGEAKWIKIHCETTIVTDCIKQLWGNRGKSHSVPTLEQLVDNAVNAIQATNPGRETTGESKKTVCVALHHSFTRQAEFEQTFKDLEPPFVAGNPIPMGKKKCALSCAAREARIVANILDGAQLFSGEKMTKAAVLRGLCHSQLVLLSTLGIKDSNYPQGGIVLRESDAAPGTSAEEILSPSDIVAMPGTIPAGLVVLSACMSGLGEVTQAEVACDIFWVDRDTPSKLLVVSLNC
uniref:CHAT domain-containing protein n=1 Tax=Physcomitrium patens TaxID=3218 RepID=A0A2K1ICG6_PHYPA|nr:hypothetical protein PHYPA_030450 [Physcomitrium patens]